MERSKVPDAIPEEFESIEAATEFWDTHSLADYWHQTEQIELDIHLRNRTVREAQDMMREPIFVIEEAPEGGYVAHALGYAIYTEADTWEELKAAVQDAVTCHFGEECRSEMVCLHMGRGEVISV